ncbi:MAG TPA: hypothetical protein VFU43_18865 [Streptosporangiaceae bacterium]|nr:hypothetical protein [Streptosporangiaceae bacterium]
MVPTIARGVEQGEGANSLTPRLWYAAMSSADAPDPRRGIICRREDIDLNEVFEQLSSLPWAHGKNTVKKTLDRFVPIAAPIPDLRGARRGPAHFPNANPDTERFPPYGER